MKILIDELNISYKQFVDADNHTRLDDMCKEIASIKEQAQMIIEYCDKYIDDLNLHGYNIDE